MLRVKVAALMVVIVAAVGLLAQPALAKKPSPTPAPILTLSPQQGSATAVVDTPSGPVALEATGTVVGARASAGAIVAATTYGRTCTLTVHDVVTGQQWRIKLTSTFYYDYSTIWQNTPSVTVSAIYPYSWSDKSAYNSYWSPTVRFANGEALLHDNYPWPDYAEWTKVLYIQEDAWGNCTFGNYNG